MKKKRRRIPVEAKVRAMKLWKIDNFDPHDIVEDIEATFGVRLSSTAHERPHRFLERVQGSLQRDLFNEKLSRNERQRLVKLLKQAGLISEEDQNV